MSVSYKAIQIELLDGSDLARSIYKKTKTREILDGIFQMLNLIEKDYFGMYFYEMVNERRTWLKPNVSIWSQIIKQLEPPYQLYFGVRYYPYDPLLLEEYLTLYMVYLQLRREVRSCRVICSQEETAHMLAYMLQAEGGDYEGGNKYKNFFLNIQGATPTMERKVLRVYEQLNGLDSQSCEIKVMSTALQTTYYNQEVYPVRSDSQPGLRRLTFTLGPVGIGIYQNDKKLDIYGWMEIWHVGWINRTFWFRIMRDGEKSKHKFHFEDCKTCEHVWKTFREYFRFYIKDREIDPKQLFGRIPPKVVRISLFTEHSTPSQRNMAIKPKISRENISGLVKDPSPRQNNKLLKEHYGVNSIKSAFSIYTSDNSLKGSGKDINVLKTPPKGGDKLKSLFIEQKSSSERQPKLSRGNGESATSAL